MSIQNSLEPACSISPTPGFKLTDEEKVRLEDIAPWFNISLRTLSKECAEILLDTRNGTQTIVVNMDIAHRRLMTEVCSRAVPWVHFHFGKSCRASLFELSDARLRRIGDLYRAHLAQSASMHALSMHALVLPLLPL